jgi:hypothetical protein
MGNRETAVAEAKRANRFLEGKELEEFFLTQVVFERCVWM